MLLVGDDVGEKCDITAVICSCSTLLVETLEHCLSFPHHAIKGLSLLTINILQHFICPMVDL